MHWAQQTRDAVRQAVLVCLLVVLWGASVAWSAQGSIPTQTPVASATRLGGDNARTRFVAELDHAIGFDVYVIPDPFRIILDLPEIDFRVSGQAGTRGRGLVSGYRYGRIEKGRSRIVLDATGPVLIDRSFVLNPRDGQPARIVVDIVRTDRETFDALHRQEQPQPPPAPISPMAALTQETGEKHADEFDLPDEDPVPALQADEAIDAAPPPAPIQAEANETEVDTGIPLPRSRPEQSVETAALEPKPVKPDAPARREKKIVVLDPGHGGIDPGALSKGHKTKEKTIVLEFAKTLKERLVATGRYKVIMTRNDDSFVTLRDRVEIARDVEADLFIAIHADSIRGHDARGATIYTVSEEASDEEAAELARMENRSDIIAGVNLETENEEIAGILIDLAQRETKNYSLNAARRMVGQLKKVTRLNARPMRSADFRVLKAPDVPSVLVELGYLSNKHDERLLVSGKWRAKVAAALAEAGEQLFCEATCSRELIETCATPSQLCHIACLIGHLTPPGIAGWSHIHLGWATTSSWSMSLRTRAGWTRCLYLYNGQWRQPSLPTGNMAH